MKNYLIDTNICIYYIKGKHDLKKKFEKVDPDNCFVSEITLAELKFGVENSEKKEKNQKALDNFLTGIKILPIFHSLDLYAKEKAVLLQVGNVKKPLLRYQTQHPTSPNYPNAENKISRISPRA